MGVWSIIKSAAKNTVKIGGGYAIGSSISHSEDEAVLGASGLAGIAGAYVIPAVGSKLFDLVSGKSSNDTTDSEKSSSWKTIGKVALIGTGTFFAGNQILKLMGNGFKTDSVHTPSSGEYLHMNDSQSTQRTGDEALVNLQLESDDTGLESP